MTDTEPDYDAPDEQPHIELAAAALAWLAQLETMIREARAHLEPFTTPEAANDAEAVVRSRAAVFVYGQENE